MTWEVIARQDARLTVSTVSTQLLVGVLVTVILLAAYVYPVVGQRPITTARFPGFVAGSLTTVVPLVGLLVGYNAVVAERESGALLLTLSLPHSREDLLVGKFLSRAGIVTGGLLVGLLGGGVLVVYPLGELELLPFLGFVVLTVAFGVLWTGLGVAVSLSVATKRRALALAFGLLVVFAFVWDTGETLLEEGLSAAGLVSGSLPQPVQFVFSLAPGRAFQRLVDGFIDPSATISGPWYASEWAAVVVFLGWLTLPLGIAYLRFAGRDLS